MSDRVDHVDFAKCAVFIQDRRVFAQRTQREQKIEITGIAATEECIRLAWPAQYPDSPAKYQVEVFDNHGAKITGHAPSKNTREEVVTARPTITANAREGYAAMSVSLALDAHVEKNTRIFFCTEIGVAVRRSDSLANHIKSSRSSSSTHASEGKMHMVPVLSSLNGSVPSSNSAPPYGRLNIKHPRNKENLPPARQLYMPDSSLVSTGPSSPHHLDPPVGPRSAQAGPSTLRVDPSTTRGARQYRPYSRPPLPSPPYRPTDINSPTSPNSTPPMTPPNYPDIYPAPVSSHSIASSSSTWTPPTINRLAVTPPPTSIDERIPYTFPLTAQESEFLKEFARDFAGDQLCKCITKHAQDKLRGGIAVIDEDPFTGFMKDVEDFSLNLFLLGSQGR
ncbi:hypothetical protein EIP91_000871 [Steccherinum ochraceum]|uniref:Uncharacterized protein n=1 Tax=Steccherinum ochraceum TaxID=92696 RepID=A0A4R0S320_9APHY|nr:hypothetical protein EIP91_000871 [Steccherinum ochraceum]